MSKIVKKDGYVYLLIEHDIEGRHKTMHNLGKDPDYWEALEKPNKKRKIKKSEEK